MASTTARSTPEQMNVETMTRTSESSMVDTDAGSFLPPPVARSPPRVFPAWNTSPHASPTSTRRTATMNPPGSPTGGGGGGGRQYHPQQQHNNNMMAPYPHQHHPQRPLSTYTTLGSPRTTTRVRSASVGNAPYQQQVIPNIFPGNPQSSSSGAGVLPFLLLGNQNPEPPELSLERKAMEAAAAAERARAKVLEEAEVDLTAEELRAVLKKERHRTAKIQADLAALRSGSVQQQLQAEVLEEGRINGLMRRMDDLQAEKGRIIVELEREEEMVSDALAFNDGWV